MTQSVSPTKKKIIWEHTCIRCSFVWKSDDPHPSRCASPTCRSPYWDRARGSVRRGPKSAAKKP